MLNDQEAERAESEVEEPDLDNIEPWLTKYITKPFKGMEAKKHPDGRQFSPEEILKATRDQFRYLIAERDDLEGVNEFRAINGLNPITPEENDTWLKMVFRELASIQQPEN